MNIFWCDYCTKKISVNDLELLKYYVRPKLQNKLPFIDTETNKKQTTDFGKNKIFFKCPECGRVLKEVLKNDEANKDN